MNVDYLLRTGFHAHAAGNAPLLIHLGHTVRIQGDSAELTDRGTIAAAHTTVTAPESRTCRTIAVARHRRRTIGEFLLYCHHDPFLSYGVPEIGRVNLRSLSRR